MKSKNAILLFLCITLTACGGVTPIPVTNTPTPKVATQTITPSPTYVPTAGPFHWETPTPDTLAGYPTAVMPIEKDPFAKNIPVKLQELSVQQLYIGKYILRNWCKADESIKSYCAIIISSLGEDQVEIWGFPAYLGKETGADLTGKGYPDIVVIAANGNAGSEIRVFEAGKTLKEILHTWSRSSGEYPSFIRLNNDDSYEFVTNIRIWSKFTSCNVGATLIYEYSPETGYINKTSKYKDVLSAKIQWSLNYLSTYKLENPNTEIPVCNVYYLVTAYLISGQKEKAWGILDENYPPEKAEEYKAGFQKDLGHLIP
jgi:hypothetical protein